ncbi:hypothetical protein, partial [Neobacillus bataviensis]|uniref:hypothetical protein n=1 Tax=Neobacillus bataviensis TaxID=220685 RepID=UPI0012F9A3FF
CGIRAWVLVHVFRLVDGHIQLAKRTFRRSISFVVVCWRGHLCPVVVFHDPQSNRLAGNTPYGRPIICPAAFAVCMRCNLIRQLIHLKRGKSSFDKSVNQLFNQKIN